MTYNDVINYIDNHEIFTSEDAAECLNCDNINEKRVLNTYLQRLTNNEKIIRYTKGIYGRTTDTILGKTFPSETQVIEYLIFNNNQGYYIGGYFYNSINISTWVPNRIEIKANTAFSCFPHYKVIKSDIRITKENRLYLQLIDCIKQINQYPIDDDNYYQKIKKYIDNASLKIETLLAYTKAYYSKGTLDTLINILVEGEIL